MTGTIRNLLSQRSPGFWFNLALTGFVFVACGLAYLATSDAGFYCQKLCACQGYDQFKYYHGRCDCIGQSPPSLNITKIPE